jgi:hypothetical protein
MHIRRCAAGINTILPSLTWKTSNKSLWSSTIICVKVEFKTILLENCFISIIMIKVFNFTVMWFIARQGSGARTPLENCKYYIINLCWNPAITLWVCRGPEQCRIALRNSSQKWMLCSLTLSLLMSYIYHVPHR